MFLTKIWFILIALAAGVAVTVALVAPRPAVQRLAALEGQRLDRAQYAAEQMLKVDAHKWIDRVSKLGRDAIISESLDSATRGAGEINVIHRTVQDRFHALIPDLASGGIGALVAVDNKGRVVARAGENDKEYGDYVGGAEVVADALRGYLSDDVWGMGGRLLRVAAAPVLSKGRDRIVGALYVGAETGDGFVERLKKNLDVDVALFLRGKPIAATGYPGLLAPLPEIIGQHSKEIEEVKRTPALSFTAGNDQLLVVAAPFPGQAGQQQAFYALIGKQPANSDLGALLKQTSSNDLKWGNFPWIPLAGGVFLAIVIGLFLQRREGESPLRRLRQELKQLAHGDILKIQDSHYGGHFGGLARDVNAAIERFTHAPTAPSEMASKDLNAILGDSAGGKAFDLPGPGSVFAGPSSSPSYPPPPAGISPAQSSARSPASFPPPPPPSFAPPPPPSFAPPPPASFLPPPPPSFAPPPPFSASSIAGVATAGDSGPPWGTLPAHALDADAMPGLAGDTDEDTHYKTIFDDFVATKRECGESIAGLTLDKFKDKLRGNRDALMSKHQCRTVRFAVYVKDGRAALKATPIRD
ncbi:MAG TPA: MXAN_5187 family protein [Polyangia bacterium]|nr:MXAN_5187 family protein [Polyangia bacterium]